MTKFQSIKAIFGIVIIIIVTAWATLQIHVFSSSEAGLVSHNTGPAFTYDHCIVLGKGAGRYNLKSYQFILKLDSMDEVQATISPEEYSVLLTIIRRLFPEAIIDGDEDVPTYLPDAYLEAIEWVESRGRADAKGDWTQWLNKETAFLDGEYRAIGSFQLWKIYVDDFNRIQELNGESYRASYEDRWDRIESRKITAVVTAHYADHDWQDKPHTQLQWIETAVRAHKCPTDRNKPSTKAYWLEVKARMEAVR